MLAVFFATYAAVFLAEIAGDKLLYTTGVLSSRYRPLPIMVGVTIAFMAKMAVAVYVGDYIAHLPRLLVASLTAAGFIGVAYTVWRKPLVPRTKKKEDHTAGKAALVSFAAIFLSEWGDVGQITAATMAAKAMAEPTAQPSWIYVVWAGAVLAMVTKGALAASIGATARAWIEKTFSPKVIRYGGVGLLVLLGVLSVLETFGIG
ncbi:MAG TPA: TMEM165/GDT1 family protein [Gemmatimonadaceae bacterium]|nr:TMEM165/GDT1 family protein [Gemmatimonadaceae bacterium]